MRSKQKIIWGIIVLLVLANVAVFSILFISNKRQAETKLVQDQAREGQKSKSMKDFVQGRIRKIENGTIEYEVVMDEAGVVTKKDREIKRTKIADGVGVYIPCETLALEQWAEAAAKMDDESLRNGGEQAIGLGEGQDSFAPREPDERCPGEIDNLTNGSLISMKIEAGKIITIKK